jgi:hypothetical protein
MADKLGWQVTIPLVRENQKIGQVFCFEFRFDAPIPELDDWPTRETILGGPARR